MERALVINDATTSNIYAIATEKDGSIRVFGADEAAKEWADWADAKLQGRGKLEDLIKFLDNSFKLEGPKPLTRPVRAQIAQHMAKFGEQAQNEIAMGRTEQPEKKTAFNTFSFMSPVADPGAAISRTTKVSSKAALINYKALAFRHEQSLASLGFEVKRARAVFDPNLAGGNGGWRCPAGTRRGGKITNRFGRNCGWGVVRRLANTITDTGERLEDRLEDRRKRRDAKRNGRMARRIGPNAPKVNRRRTGIARALERGDADIAPNGQPRRTRRGAPERMDDLADRVDGGYGRRPRAERRAGRSGQRSTRPGGQAGRTGLPERMDRAAQEVLEGTFLENRRRRRQRQGRARNREGLPERMDRAAGEVLEGTFLENRRRRRQAVTQQAQERPRVARTNRTNRSERTPARPSRRTRAGEATPKPKPETEPEAETPTPKQPKRDERFRRAIPDGDSPRHGDYVDSADMRRRQSRFIARLTKEREANNKVIRDYQGDGQSLNVRIRQYERTYRDHDRVARDGNRSLDDRMDAAENRDIAIMLVADMREAEKNKRNGVNPSPPEEETAPQTPEAPSSRPPGRVDPIRQSRRLNPTTSDERKMGEQTGQQERMIANSLPTDNELAIQRLVNLRAAYKKEEERYKAIHENRELPEEERRSAMRGEIIASRMGFTMEEMIRGRQLTETQRRERETQPLPAETYGNPRNRREGLPVTSESIEDLIQRSTFDAGVAKAEEDARKRAEAAVKKAAGDQEKLRELASKAQRSLYAATVQNEGRDPRGNTPTSMQQRIEAITDMSVARAEGEIYRAALQSAYELNGENKPTPERIAEIGIEARKEVKETLARRARNLGNFLKTIYGDQPAPWLAEDRVRAEDLDGMSNAALNRWAAKIYELDEFTTPNGAVFKTQMSGVSRTGAKINVTGNIYAKNPETGDWVSVGSYNRDIYPGQKRVYHASMGVYPSLAPENMRASIRNSGFASVFNGHAITWLKGAGFEKSNVTAANDGPFVWARLGFRTGSVPAIDSVHKKMREQLDNYRQGKRTIIANDRDAAKIEFLLNQRRRNNASDVQHNDFILALSNRDEEDQVVRNFFRGIRINEDVRREERTGISEWFAFSGGDLAYDDDAFPSDPRRP